MSEPFEQAMLAAIADLKQDVNRASDRHEAGMRKLFDIHEAHAKDDITRFESIDQKFASAAATAAESKGAAKATAKVWGLMAGLPAPIFGAVWAIWKAFHGLK